jgi:hypothetical protein
VGNGHLGAHSCRGIQACPSPLAQEDDITTLLPNEATKTSTERPSIKRIDALDIRSPGFFSSHPPAFVRSAGMLIKSVVRGTLW